MCVCAHKTSRLGRRRSVVPFTFFKRHIHWKDMAIGTLPYYTPRYIGQLKQCIPKTNMAENSEVLILKENGNPKSDCVLSKK